MTQSIFTAGDATAQYMSWQGGNDGTMKLVVGPAGGKLDGMILGADGKPMFPQVATGSAPIFFERAWAMVNPAAGSVLGGGNIASITKTAVGSYAVVFSVNMPSSVYGISISVQAPGTAGVFVETFNEVTAGPTLSKKAQTSAGFSFVTMTSAGFVDIDLATIKITC